MNLLALKKLVLVVAITAGSLNTEGHQGEKDSLRYEILLTPGMTSEVVTEGTFINSIDATPDQLLLLSTSGQFYILGWGGISPAGKKNKGNICSFARTSDNLLMTIRNDELCASNESGELIHLFTLPSTGMGISRGRFGMYIFDMNGTRPQQAVFVITHGGKYSKLFEVPEPVYSLVEHENYLIFTNGNTIYSFNLETREMKALVSLPDNKTIRSMTIDPISEKIYFSTDNMVLALDGSRQEVITDKMGGKLMFLDGLVIFNPENNYLVRIAGLDRN